MVFLNLEKSKYKVKKAGMILYFSSEFNKRRFFSRVDEYIINETLKLNNKYKVKANYTLILILAFYKKIEKRGWRIEFEDGRFIKENSIIFAIEME